MNKVFCPYIQGLCTDGYPGDFPCVFFDQEEGVCLIKENLKNTTEQFKLQAGMRAKFETFNKLLKDVNLG